MRMGTFVDCQTSEYAKMQKCTKVEYGVLGLTLGRGLRTGL
jgi:hypothetical protein